MRILLFGDGAWAANSLLQLRDAGHTIAAAVMRRQPSDAVLAETCRRLRLPILQPRRVNDADVVQTVAAFAPDLCLSISYNQILRRPILDAARRGFVNFHAGKLPYYRGRNVINWAIINGESEIGLTAHRIDEGIDTGDILLQRALPIHWTDTYGDVLNRVVAAFPDFVCETVARIASGDDQAQAQAHLPGTYFCGREDGDEWLDWNESSLNLYNKVRAITRPGPGARTLHGDKEVIIWRAAYDRAWPSYVATPGQVVGRSEKGVMVKTGDSTLLLEEVQTGDEPSRPPVWPIGTRLGLNLAGTVRALLSRIKELENRLSSEEKTHGASRSR